MYWNKIIFILSNWFNLWIGYPEFFNSISCLWVFVCFFFSSVCVCVCVCVWCNWMSLFDLKHSFCSEVLQWITIISALPENGFELSLRSWIEHKVLNQNRLHQYRLHLLNNILKLFIFYSISICFCSDRSIFLTHSSIIVVNQFTHSADTVCFLFSLGFFWFSIKFGFCFCFRWKKKSRIMLMGWLVR